MRIVKMMCCAVALTAFLAPSAQAQNTVPSHLTYLTFSGPVHIPGMTLPAGSYAFRTPDPSGDVSQRHILMILNKDQTKVFATVMTIPDQRLTPTDKPVVMFNEAPAGMPQPVRAWFYPGDPTGEEFVYPRSEAVKIAKATHQRVLSMEDTTKSDDMKSAKVGRVDENGNVGDSNDNDNHGSAVASNNSNNNDTASNNSNANNNSHSGNNAQMMAQNNNHAPDTSRSMVGTAGHTRRHLPRTASPLALYELISGLSFAGAFGIRRFRQ